MIRNAKKHSGLHILNSPNTPGEQTQTTSSVSFPIDSIPSNNNSAIM